VCLDGMILCLIVVWNYLLCEIGFWHEFRISSCEEQFGNPNNFAQASSSRLSESIRELPLLLCEVSPRRARVA